MGGCEEEVVDVVGLRGGSTWKGRQVSNIEMGRSLGYWDGGGQEQDCYHSGSLLKLHRLCSLSANMKMGRIGFEGAANIHRCSRCWDYTSAIDVNCMSSPQSKPTTTPPPTNTHSHTPMCLPPRVERQGSEGMRRDVVKWDSTELSG